MSQLKLFTFRHEDGSTSSSNRSRGIDGLRDTIRLGLRDLKNTPSNEIHEDIDLLYDKFSQDLSEFEEGLKERGCGVVGLSTRVLEEALNSPDGLLRARIERAIEKLKSTPDGFMFSDKDLHSIIAVLS